MHAVNVGTRRLPSTSFVPQKLMFEAVAIGPGTMAESSSSSALYFHFHSISALIRLSYTDNEL